MPLPVQLGVTVVLILTVLVFGGFLRQGQGSVGEVREP
jgi:hypothetical protein